MTMAETMYNYTYYDNFTNVTRVTNSVGLNPQVARVTLLLTSILIISANIIVLIVFQYMKTLENMTGVFIRSLAVADLGVGVSVLIAIQSQWAAEWPHEMWSCKLMGYLLAVMVAVSILSLTCVSIDRYIAIIKPLKYKSIVTKRRARIYALIVWILVLLLFLPAMFSWGGYAQSNDCKVHFDKSISVSFCMICILIIPSIVISIFCYYHILHACLAQTRHIERLETLFHEPDTQDTNARIYERMLAKMFLIVISAFYFSWIPFVIQKILEVATQIQVHPVVSFLTAWLGFLNSFLNCIIYIIGHQSFRDGFYLMFRSYWRGIISVCKTCKDLCFSKGRERSQSQVIQLREFSVTDC